MREFWPFAAAVALAGAATPWLCRAITHHTRQTCRPVWVAVWTCAAMSAVAVWTPRDPVILTVAVAMVAAGIVAAHVDAACHVLPDVITLGGCPVVGAVLILGGIADRDADALLRAAGAAAVCLAGYSLPAMLGAMGYGDVKLAALLGLGLGWISWESVVEAAVAAFAIGGLSGLPRWWRGDGGSHIAFGPALLSGALLTLVHQAAGPPVWGG